MTLTVPLSEGAKEEDYLKALLQAEASCLITNSIKAETHLHPKIELSRTE